MNNKTYTLTKSKYIKGLQCEKALWLDTYARNKGMFTSETNAKLDAGKDFEAKFKATFPTGINLKAKSGLTINNYPTETTSLLQKEEITIFEAGFLHEKTLVLTDVLQKISEAVTIYEIKNSTRLTNVILQDLSVQYYVVSAVLGKKLKSFKVVLNNGKTLNSFSKLFWSSQKVRNKNFMIIDMTDVLQNNQEKVRVNLEKFQQIVSNKYKCPEKEIGEHCKYPHNCEFQEFCKRDEL